jgi:hypothetical protein
MEYIFKKKTSNGMGGNQGLGPVLKRIFEPTEKIHALLKLLPRHILPGLNVSA